MPGEDLGSIVRKLRTDRGISQEALATMLGLSRSSLVQIEAGRRKLSAVELLELARVFGMSVDELAYPKKRPEVEVLLGSREGRPSLPPRVSVPQEKADKFREVLLYILDRVGARPHVGETVVYKLLYFADFDFYERHEEQLIGAKYIKNHYGPSPMSFHKLVEKMVEEGSLEVVKSSHYQYPQTKYLPLRAPDLEVLRATELEVIDEVLDRLGSMNASQISAYSHKDVPWLVAEENKPLDYESVFYRTPEYSARKSDPTRE